ncbi:DUF5722 domain-containing protein [Coraliomargarita sp. SDUM461003]|uniref:DUF5722 domain-containing protein n=1 Tax=Thalassobacterium maritimum TaxID=3041265 RepID=A0ABU1AUR3_9BACT|nr:DUF5722 domain-containing protein [Coraliomargarita sp. SDUM461003]MDQ8207904.1 DUF5722 domain-containing protein [Coraliomargarita sp. SDUM461003]
MKKLFYLISLLLLASHGLNAASPLRIDFSKNVDVTVERTADNALQITTTGNDPQIVLSSTRSTGISEDSHILAFEYFCPDGVDFLEVFYSKSLKKPNWSQSRQLEGGALPKAEAWQPYSINLKTGTKGKWTAKDDVIRIDIGRRPGTQIQMRNLQLRAPTQEEQMNAAEAEAIQARKLATAKSIEAYLHKENWPERIANVSVQSQQIVLSGTIQNSSHRSIHLIEYLPHEDPWNSTHGTLLNMEPLTGKYEVHLPRFQADGRDRIANRYALAQAQPNGETTTLLSPAVWATDLSAAAERDIPRLRPANKKGLGGITYKEGIYHDDLGDLGITASTVNIELGNLINLGPNAEIIEYTHQGKLWKFNAAAVHQHDKNIRQLTDMGIVTSAILLVGKHAGLLVHPDYQSAGIYSMANLTTEASSDLYRAIVSFLAERYSRPDKKHGWITHWIVFNEVDYGWIWTNMGETPMATYMDTYEKAMRLTYIEARRFNPTAEVFISLTHHWNYSPADKFKAYPPRALLDRLADYSTVSGDYQWAIAYHPYPQSLLKPRTWEDTKATNHFDSPMITPKNIEVLDAYLSQDRFLYKKNKRTIVLSEQGYHTPDYSQKSMKDKAAAIAYTWAKIMPLDSIESFHYHRWVDHPMEGGLKVGLRTLPSKEHPFGIRKEPAFSVYSALETPAEASTTAPFKSVIGIDDWTEVQVSKDTIKANQY